MKGRELPYPPSSFPPPHCHRFSGVSRAHTRPTEGKGGRTTEQIGKLTSARSAAVLLSFPLLSTVEDEFFVEKREYDKEFPFSSEGGGMRGGRS